MDWMGNLLLMVPRRDTDRGEGEFVRRAMVGMVWMVVGGVLMLAVLIMVVMRYIWRRCKML